MLYYHILFKKQDYRLIIPAVCEVMSILGALGVGNNVALAFCLVIIILCRKLKLDPLVVAGTMYFASNSGFTTSPINPFTVLLAQNLSGVTQMSGLFARSIMWVIFTVITVWWILRYCKKILKDPSKSYMEIYEQTPSDIDEKESMNVLIKMKTSHVINLVVLIAVFAVYAYGGIKYNWDLPALGTAMMALAFLAIMTLIGWP